MNPQSRKRRLQDEESAADQSHRPFKLTDSGNSFNASSASVATSSRHQWRALLPRPPLASVSGNSQGVQLASSRGGCVLDRLVQRAVVAERVVKMGTLARKIKNSRPPNAHNALGYTADQMMYSDGRMTALFREWVQLFSLQPSLLDLASPGIRQMFEFQNDWPPTFWMSIENFDFTSAGQDNAANCGPMGETAQAPQTYVTGSGLSVPDMRNENLWSFENQGMAHQECYPIVSDSATTAFAGTYSSTQLEPALPAMIFDTPQPILNTGNIAPHNILAPILPCQELTDSQPTDDSQLAIDPNLEFLGQPTMVSGSVSGSAGSPQEQIVTPSGVQRLSRGRTLYRFSRGEKRVFEEILGEDLPQEAENGKIHDLESFCPPPNVDISLLDFNVSAEELLTFFPRHTMWYAISNRLATHDWSARTIIHYIHSTRDLGDANTVQRTTMEKRLTASKAWNNENPPKIISANPSHMSNKWSQKSRSPPHMDYFVVDLTEGLNEPKLPETGRLTLSRVVQHVLDNDNRDLRLSEVNEYARQHGLLVPDNGYDVKAEDSNAAKSLAGKSRTDFVAKFNARLA